MKVYGPGAVAYCAWLLLYLHPERNKSIYVASDLFIYYLTKVLFSSASFFSLQQDKVTATEPNGRMGLGPGEPIKFVEKSGSFPVNMNFCLWSLVYVMISWVTH